MDKYLTKKNLIIGSVVLVLVVIIAVVLLKKEKFVIENGFVKSSGAGKDMVPNIQLIADSVGNLSTSTDGLFEHINTTGLVRVNGYPGKIGDVLVSNGDTAPPVWAPGVGMDDFNGEIDKIPQQKLEENGYQILPGGLIIQWGSNIGIAGGGTAPFPIPFPKACLSFVASPKIPDYGFVFGYAQDKTKFVTYGYGIGNDGATPTNWIATGI